MFYMLSSHYNNCRFNKILRLVKFHTRVGWNFSSPTLDLVIWRESTSNLSWEVQRKTVIPSPSHFLPIFFLHVIPQYFSLYKAPNRFPFQKKKRSFRSGKIAQIPFQSHLEGFLDRYLGSMFEKSGWKVRWGRDHSFSLNFPWKLRIWFSSDDWI